MWKKSICIFLALVVLLMPLCACGKKEGDARLRVVCTVFPLYDWARNLVGDTEGVELIWLADQGTDLHSYQPSADDMVQIASADLVIYVGGASDIWVTEALKHADQSVGMALCEAEGVTLRCVSAESEHDHHAHEHGHETDEHIWLSLKNAAACAEAICNRLCELDEDYADQYRANTSVYLEKLNGLDLSFAETAERAQEPRLLFADRFPFIYLTEDYGMEYVAAFNGCTTDTDADFSTVVRLAETAERWETSYILVTESSDEALARSVIGATKAKNQTVVRMDSLQAVSAARCEEGVTYLSVMEENLAVLRRVLETKE